jgi:imidazolonepropionase-like amidohydrolase
MGGTLALGDDSGYETRTWMPIREMQRLLAAGLTPMEIIQAGTQHAAQVCGHGNELGTLEPGKLADVIVVNGDPLTDIGAMNRISVVIVDGQVAVPSK